MIAAYGQAYTRLQADLERLTNQIETAKRAGEQITPAWLRRQERYQILIRQTGEELVRLANFANGLISAAQLREIQQGIEDAGQMLNISAEEAGIAAVFDRLPVSAAEQLVGALGDGSPLSRLLGQLPGDGKAAVEKALIEGVALGENPRKVARRMRDALGGNLTRALRIARTEQLRAYRESTRKTFEQNKDLVYGWQWLSARQPGRTCPVCWAMDGQIFPVEKPIGNHVNCRCTMLSVLRSSPAPLQKTGEELFEKLSDAQKLKTLGPAKFEAYKNGQISLRSLVGYKNSRKWGEQRTERSLKDALRGEINAKWGMQPMDYKPTPAKQDPLPFVEPEPAPAPPAPPPTPAAPPVLPQIEPAKQKTAKEAREAILALFEKQNPADQQARRVAERQAQEAVAKALRIKDPEEKRKAIQDAVALAKRLDQEADQRKEPYRRLLYQPKPLGVSVEIGDGFTAGQKEEFRRGALAFRRLVGPKKDTQKKVEIKKTAKSRAYYSPSSKAVNANKATSARVIAHELGHWLEDHSKEIFDAISEFLTRRTEGDTRRRMRELDPPANYDASEWSRPDKFWHPYVGLDYSSNGKRVASEVLSMGIEWFYSDPAGLAQNDPDMFDFIYDLLRK